MKINYLILVAILSFLSACKSYAPFTEPMLKEFKLDTKNIKGVQFYISEEIVMFKINPSQSMNKQGDVVVKANEGITEKIRIKRYAPCRVEKIDKDGTFHVRFEDGKDKVLKFQRQDNNRYYLLTEIKDNRYQVNYGGEWYYVNTPSLVGFIMVEVQNTKNTPNERSIGGRR